MGNTAEKLQALVNGKQSVVDAVNSKANTTLNINSKWSDIANIVKDISTGNDTSDATATADNILEGKTAYIATGKVEGAMEIYDMTFEGGAEYATFPEGSITLTENGTYDVKEYAEAIVDVKKPSGNKEITTTDPVDVTDYSTAQVRENNLKAENIKEGVSILGVDGSYQGIIPTGTKEIIENGEHNVKEYEKVNVNVSAIGYTLKEAINEYILGKNPSYSPTGYRMNDLFKYFHGDINEFVDQEMLNKSSDFASTFAYCLPKTKIPDFTVTTTNSIMYNCFESFGSGYTGKYDDMLPTVTFTGDKAQLNKVFYRAKVKKVPKWYFPNATYFTFSEMFQESTIEEIPDWDFSKAKIGAKAFQDCTNLKDKIERLAGATFSSGEYLFNNCSSLEEIPFKIDILTDTYVWYMFSGCTSLHTIEGLDLIGTTKSLTSIFNNCKALTNLKLYNVKSDIQIASGTSYGHLITKESLIQIIGELIKPASGTRRLTMGNTNISKLADVYVKVISEEPDENGNIKLPLTVCESTDEGAILITNYVTLKNWSLA